MVKKKKIVKKLSLTWAKVIVLVSCPKLSFLCDSQSHPKTLGFFPSSKTATLGVVSKLGLLIFAKALSSPLLKGITEEQRVIIKDDICSLWLKMTKWNFKCRSQHCNLMHKGVFAHLLPAKWSPSVLQSIFLKFAFKWGLLFKWGPNASRHHQSPKIYRFC